MINIVVPAYNEARNVTHVIENIATVFGAIEPKRVIVVDDGSDDDTESVVALLLQRYPFVEYVKHQRNLGLGAALRTGYLRCSDGMAGWLPADGQFDAKWILSFRSVWERTGAPIVVGNVTSVQRMSSDGLFRLALSKGLRALRFLRKKRHISFNGLMLFDVSLAPVAQFKASTGLVNFEILEWFEQRNARIEYQEITLQPRLSGKSKVTNLRSYVAVLRDMIFS